MQTRHQIAILAAGLLVGAQIGVAAIDTMIPESEQYMEPAPGEAQALDSGAVGEPTETAGEPAPVADEKAPTAITEAAQPILPVAPRYIEARSNFPASADDLQMLPAMADYLARTEHLRVTGAKGGFPPSADELTMLPAMAAFLEQRDAARFAALSPAPAATGVASAVPVNGRSQATAPAAAQAPEREVAALDTRSPLSTGTPF